MYARTLSFGWRVASREHGPKQVEDCEAHTHLHAVKGTDMHAHTHTHTHSHTQRHFGLPAHTHSRNKGHSKVGPSKRKSWTRKKERKKDRVIERK